MWDRIIGEEGLDIHHKMILPLMILSFRSCRRIFARSCQRLRHQLPAVFGGMLAVDKIMWDRIISEEGLKIHHKMILPLMILSFPSCCRVFVILCQRLRYQLPAIFGGMLAVTKSCGTES
jgi:hypothetical protein